MTTIIDVDLKFNGFASVKKKSQRENGYVLLYIAMRPEPVFLKGPGVTYFEKYWCSSSKPQLRAPFVTTDSSASAVSVWGVITTHPVAAFASDMMWMP